MSTTTRGTPVTHDAPLEQGASASLIGECARCDKPFQPGERVCVVAFGHLEFHLGAEPETARISDCTVLCLACEELISDTWPFLPGDGA